jgi:hypothetical protein
MLTSLESPISSGGCPAWRCLWTDASGMGTTAGGTSRQGQMPTTGNKSLPPRAGGTPRIDVSFAAPGGSSCRSGSALCPVPRRPASGKSALHSKDG